MASVPEQDRAGGFPGHIHPVTPGGPLTPAFHVGHGGLYPLTTGQLHVVRRDVAKIGNVVYRAAARSEEHTSELQSRPHLVCRLLLEKKKKVYNYRTRNGRCGSNNVY